MLMQSLSICIIRPYVSPMIFFLGRILVSYNNVRFKEHLETVTWVSVGSALSHVE